MTAIALSAPELAARRKSFFSQLGKKDNPLRIAVIILYIAAVVLGATTSSIGMPTLRENPTAPLGLQLGEASPIRSDEYNAFSPIVLSIMATGAAPTTSVLAAPADLTHRYSSGGFFETLVFFDSSLLYTASFLPDAMVFAAHWWLPALLLFLFLPTWFEQVGSSRRWGWMAAFLIALSPAASWWTMMPIQLIAYTIAGSSLILSAYRRFTAHQRVVPALQCLAAGILIAGLPSFYIPWSLVLGLPMLVATVAWVIAHQGQWKPKLLALGCSGLTAMIFAAGMLWENREGINALLQTVYPGSRRSTGTAQSFALLFGAPGLAPMQDMLPVGINQSELSTAFTITFVWAVLLVVNLNFFGQLRENIAIIVVAIFGLLWLLWCTVNFGERGTSIPLLNYVQPARAAQVCGILGSILVCLLLARLPRKVNWKLPLTAAASCAVVTAYAVSSLQLSYLPEMSRSSIAAAAFAVGLCVFCATKFPSKVWPIVLTSVLAAVPVYSANPLLFGLGDLRDSETAKYLSAEGKRAAETNGVWASDFGPFDTVMLANGVPSMSGLQRSGPDTEQWKKLDPDASHANEWNRGGGFIHFQWATTGEPMTFEAPVPDTTVVRIDPCDLKLRWPNLQAISSSQSLDAACLIPERTLTWSGKEFFVYKFQ
ncbi:hypothetical protein M8J71_14330 [Pseudarthrobacter sp. R1]|uniref:DUF7657 domain-containing protein n=1 Tax=Pseudarthrobacter sp. R1 TaxID=2944934 RepID=UPI002108F34F|nr:hypothetical protein [Pseudarthrobacter sp. R1]MCQ6271657.1 hypothetical protein [Pseudarthrobacter sp. R1]